MHTRACVHACALTRAHTYQHAAPTHQQREHHVPLLLEQEAAERGGVMLNDAEQHIRGLELGGLVADLEDAGDLRTEAAARGCRMLYVWGEA